MSEPHGPSIVVVDDAPGQLAVRVDDGNTFPVPEVLNDHVAKHRRFTGTGFTENVDMLTTVFALYAEDLFLVAEVCGRKVREIPIEFDSFGKELLHI